MTCGTLGQCLLIWRTDEELVMDKLVEWAINYLPPHGGVFFAFIAYTIFMVAFVKFVILPIVKVVFDKRVIGVMQIVFERDAYPNVSDGKKILYVGVGLFIPSWLFFSVSLLAKADMDIAVSVPFLRTLLQSALLAAPMSLFLAYTLLLGIGFVDDLLIHSQKQFQYPLAYMICGFSTGLFLLGTYLLIGLLELPS
jgi:hypothetical protein